MLAAFGWVQALQLLGVGTLAGLLGGLLGVGGGIVMIPALVILLGDNAYGPDSFHVYKLGAITTSIVLSALAAARHARAKAPVYAMLPSILPLALVGVIVGVLAAGTFVGEHTVTLRRIFGGFLELVVVALVYQDWRARSGRNHIWDRCPMPSRRTLIGTVVGLPAGFIAGMLGIGGGVWAVPAQRLLLGVRIRNAIANSAFMIVGVGLATSITLGIMLARISHEQPLHLCGWWLALWLAPGGVVGAWLGAGLTHRLPVRWLRYALEILLLVSGLRLMLA